MTHTTIETTQNEETNSGIFLWDNSTFALFYGMKSKIYKTEKAALRAWNKLEAADLV